jgi:radical SAM protein with 4Fe4S-binding SPASM domain
MNRFIWNWGGQNDVFKNLYGDKADMVFEKSQGTNIYKNKKICRYPFTHLTIRSDGKVVLCCADWLKELTIGNVMDHSLEELWESKTLYNIRCGMIEQKGLQYKVCHNCEIPYRDMPEDNIDELTEDKLSFENDF